MALGGVSGTMTIPAMLSIATMIVGAAIDAEPATRSSEVPELASMALLSVLLVAISVAVRRAATKADDRDRRKSAPRS